MPIEGAAEFAEGSSGELPGVEAVDPHTVRIRLNRSYPSFLEVLAMDGVKIVPRHVLETAGEEAFARSPVGTGPFRFEAWAPEGIRLVANRDYFGPPPYLDRVELLFFGEAEADVGVERFLRGELDVVEPGSRHLETLERLPATRVRRYQELSVSFLGLQCTAAPLDDVRVRQAIAHALDRKAFVAAAPSTRREAVGLLPPGLWGYSPQPKALPHDPARAEALLLEAGHPRGVDLPVLSLMIPENSPAAKQLSEGIAADLDRIGLAVSVESLSWGELGDRIDRRVGHMFLMAWIADLPDPDALLRSLFESGGSANYFAFRDPRTEELLGRGAAEDSPDLRARIYRDLERRILGLAPIVPLYHTLGIVATRESVHGFEPGPLGIANVGLERVWIDPRGRS
jgi:ABC-type transport system substrate-binding protein